ncbi:MAG: DUF2161 family putative PD-(D/E)XK-type phosphodiesterase [Vulcanimicrobiota bacterium]
MKESDLYPPVKRFLEKQHYEVKSEVGDCDVVAVRGDEPPVVVELKLSLNLEVVLQAVDRLALSPNVYIGIPAPSRLLARRRKSVLKLVKMLGLGLLLVDGEVTVAVDPGPYRPRLSRHRQERLLGEFLLRVGDPNLGGSNRRGGVMTAYRQSALKIGCHLQAHGATKASQVAAAVAEPRARDFLYRNVYGWFEPVGRGVYRLSPRGEREIRQWLERDL